MTKKIKVDILREGSNNSGVLAMVAANNAGTLDISKSDIIGFLTWRKVEYPAMNKELTFRTRRNEDYSELYIYEDGKDRPTLSLTWVEVHELATNPDDLKDVKFN